MANELNIVLTVKVWDKGKKSKCVHLFKLLGLNGQKFYDFYRYFRKLLKVISKNAKLVGPIIRG